jgi:hypothetical protein
MEWRALWDNTNLYVMAKVHDNVIVNGQPEFGGPDSNNGWEDDAVEFYIDAQNVDNIDYRPENTGEPFQPTFQFTSVAGWTPAIANDPENPGGRTMLGRDPAVVPNSSFTWGTTSYGGNQTGVAYPQDLGSATSGPITGSVENGFDYTFEASFPWTALQETPADILARGGIFGFGVAVNDDDFAGGVAPSTRENQYMWASDLNNLWNTSASFPDVQLVEAAGGSLGDYNDNGTVDAADYTIWRNNLGQPEGNLLNGNGNGGTIDATDYALWKTNFGAGGGALAGSGSAIPEPATLLLASRQRPKGMPSTPRTRPVGRCPRPAASAPARTWLRSSPGWHRTSLLT